MTKRSKQKARKPARRDPSVGMLKCIDAALGRAEKVAGSAAMILQLWPTSVGVTPAVAASVTVIKGHIENARRNLLTFPGMSRKAVQ